MRRLVTPLITSMFLIFAVSAFAQNHGEVSVFGDYYRLHSANDLNLYGLGGRISVNVHPHAALEAEGAYDFEQSGTFSGDNNGLTNTYRSNFKATHFLSGLALTAGKEGPFRVFGVLKGGFTRFGTTPGPVTFGNFPTRLQNTDTYGEFYPGGGVEAFAGFLGVRIEAGDEMFFNNGVNHNLKLTFGPVLRF